MFKFKDFQLKITDEVLLSIPELSLENKVYGLIGPSLSGKSLFLKALGGVFPAYGQYKNIQSSLMFQENALFDNMNVYENVAFPLRIRGARNYEERVNEVLIAVDMYDARSKSIDSLSGGMKKRVAFARCLANDQDAYLIDDPTSGLDPLTSARIMSVIRTELGNSKCCIIASHDLRRLFPVCDQLLAFFEGKMILLNKDEICKHEKISAFVSARFDINSF